TAWETWERQGICVHIDPQSQVFHNFKNEFLNYAEPRRQKWDWRGGSDNLDAPPSTYISTFERDFSTDPRVAIWGNDQRFVVSKDDFHGEMRDPSSDDLDLIKKFHDKTHTWILLL
ncbi:unnamed protein product, partial [marine sediment metagenome]